MRWPFRRRDGQPSGPLPRPSVPGRAWARTPAMHTTVELTPPTLAPVLRMPDVTSTRPLPDRADTTMVSPAGRPRGRVSGLARLRRAAFPALTHRASAGPTEASDFDVVPEPEFEVPPEFEPTTEPEPELTPAPAPNVAAPNVASVSVPRRVARVVHQPAVDRPALTQAVDDYVGEPRAPQVPHRTSDLDRLFHQNEGAQGNSSEMLALALAGFSSTAAAPPPRADEPKPIIRQPAKEQTHRRATLAQSRRLGLTPDRATAQASDAEAATDDEPAEPDDAVWTVDAQPASDDDPGPDPAGPEKPSPASPTEVDFVETDVVGPPVGGPELIRPIEPAAPQPQPETPQPQPLRAALPTSGAILRQPTDPAPPPPALFSPTLPQPALPPLPAAQAVADQSPRRRLGLGAPLTSPPRRPSPPQIDAPPLSPIEPSPTAEPQPVTVDVPADVATTFRTAFGVDVGTVAVHRGSAVSEQARSVSARAFTQRGEVYLPAEAGHLAEAGTRALLAHELVHATQQRALGADLPPEDSPAGVALEAEAVAAEQWFQGVGPTPTTLVHRPPAPPHPPTPAQATNLPATNLPTIGLLPTINQGGADLAGFSLPANDFRQRAGDQATPAHPLTSPDPFHHNDIWQPSALDPTTPVDTWPATPLGQPAMPTPTQPPTPTSAPVHRPEPELAQLKNTVAQLADRVDQLDGRRPASDPPTGRELDDLAHRLYRRIRGNLRRELLVDRERAGLLTDLR